MAMRSVMSRKSFGRFMEGNFEIPSLSGLRRFSGDTGKVLDEEGRAKEAIYVQKMEREKMEKMKLKAEKDNADKSDKKDGGDSRKGVN